MNRSSSRNSNWLSYSKEEEGKGRREIKKWLINCGILPRYVTFIAFMDRSPSLPSNELLLCKAITAFEGSSPGKYQPILCDQPLLGLE